MNRHLHTAVHTKWQKISMFDKLHILQAEYVHVCFKGLHISFLGSIKHCFERRKILNLNSWLLCSLILHLATCFREKKVYLDFPGDTDYSFHQNNSIHQCNTQIIWPSASIIGYYKILVRWMQMAQGLRYFLPARRCHLKRKKKCT